MHTTRVGRMKTAKFHKFAREKTSDTPVKKMGTFASQYSVTLGLNVLKLHNRFGFFFSCTFLPCFIF